MRVTLGWRGPVGAGSFPDDPVALEAMLAPGVYLRVKRYARGRVVSYVGQSRSVLARIDQHLAQMLSFQHALRDEAGDVWMRGDFAGRLRCYGDIGAASSMAAGEAARTRFYWAPCEDAFDVDHLSVVEATLKHRLEAGAAAENGLCLTENRQAVPFAALDEPISIENNFASLAADDRALLVRLLGDAAIAFDRDPAEMLHA